ncbi:MAG: flagellar biosynthesis anti-sigma factor FlgM [Thermoguttaceae bacterium]|nr:flagellar biosynthesis anti-sigma factor FlgM [Thermoguttaceae bacterium]
MDINSVNNINNASRVSSIRNTQSVKSSETAKIEHAQPQEAQISDELEISTTAQRLSATRAASAPAESGEIRYDLVNRLREEIANGTYDTPARFDIAMERLLSRLG